MGDEQSVFETMAQRALTGRDSHAGAANIFEGLDWKLAGERPGGAPHSAFQLANHMSYWMEWAVKWFEGKKPRAPKHASGGWPGGVGPANRREWERTGRRYRQLLEALERWGRQGDLLAKRGKTTRLEMLHILGSHTSYHAGQVAMLRQMLGAWPPPSGGVTW